MIDTQRLTGSVSLRGNVFLDRDNKPIATLSDSLEPARLSTYAHLFAAAPELLEFLETQISLAMKTAEAKPGMRPSLTGYTSFTPYFPPWFDHAMQAVSLAYGEDSTISRKERGLSITESEGDALQDSNGEVVVRFSKQSSKDQLTKYVNLFLAAPILLQIVDSMASEGLAAIEREYSGGISFDPLGADVSHFIIPDDLKFICELVAKAKGAAPLTRENSGDTIPN
jgi:hypothetical protein